MFGISRNKLIENLHKMQRHACCYDMGHPFNPPPTCDCKYGYDPKDSEQTGCPELRTVVALLSAMDDEQFYTLCNSAGILVMGE